MADGVDIDLYADVEEFNQDELDLESSDLYDDVLASSTDTKEEKDKKVDPGSPDASSSTSSVAHSSFQGHLSRRYQLYVGNLTWWTTDQDIQDAVQSTGIDDFLEVKFYENRANGQSKGFCCISVGSENSMRVIMEKLPKKELHEQTPVVTYATKQALMQFESQSKTRPTQQQQPMYQQRSGGPPPSVGRPMGIRGPPPQSSSVFDRPPPGIIRHPGIAMPPPGLPSLRGPPPGLPHMMVPVHIPAGPVPHVNPAFFPHGPPPPSMAMSLPLQGLGEVEFEEIMSRNRTVSSSAIARAVQDAAGGDFGSAIETLVTAISLIKQSKVANDDRCRILVSSLQDTLHGIENKSYGRRSSRERSRSRERERHRLSSRHREHSREDAGYSSRSREFPRERSPLGQERDYRIKEERYYEERYKERRSAEDHHRESSRSSREDRGDGRSRGGDDREKATGRH